MKKLSAAQLMALSALLSDGAVARTPEDLNALIDEAKAKAEAEREKTTEDLARIARAEAKRKRKAAARLVRLA